MRTSKKIIVFILLNILAISLATLCLSQASVVKILMKDAKTDKYDSIILGESHGESCLDPFVLSDNTDLEAFNLARRGMPVIDLPYILEEANTSNQYKTVILDIGASYWIHGHEGNAGTDNNLFFRLTGKRQWDYFKNVLWSDNYNELFFDYLLNPTTLKNIPRNLKAKFNIGYWLCKEDSLNEIFNSLGVKNSYKYIGRGFRYGYKHSGVEWTGWEFDESLVEQENLDAFERLANYCKENEIELICVQSAISPYRLKTENFDDVHEYFTKLCNEYNVSFYDMNYLKKGYLDRTDDDYVDIDGHMMGELADRHTKVLADIINADDKSVFFYDDYNDVLNSLED